MKLSEFKDEKALEVLADLIEPITAISTDEAVKNAFKAGSKAAAIKTMIKGHAKEVMQIMAILEGVPPENYHCNLLTLPKKLLEILNDSDVMSLFTDAEKTAIGEPSGSATENTGA